MTRHTRSTTGRLLLKARGGITTAPSPGNTHAMTTRAKGRAQTVDLAARLARNAQLLQEAVAALSSGQPGPTSSQTTNPPPTPQSPPAPPKPVHTFTDVHTFNRAANQPEPDTVYKFGTYEWETDGKGRVAKVEGQIKLKKHGRQITDGVTTVSIGQSEDAEAGDVGFHLIGDQFNGPINNLNVVPGNGVSVGALKSLNLSGYKRWENQIAKLARQNKKAKVTVRIDAVYSKKSPSSRPRMFTAAYKDENGAWVKTVFRNKAGG